MSTSGQEMSSVLVASSSCKVVKMQFQSDDLQV